MLYVRSQSSMAGRPSFFLLAVVGRLVFRFCRTTRCGLTIDTKT